MANLVQTTDYILMDEPCLQMDERNLVATDGHGWRRYQRFIVLRSERPAEHVIDMGPRESFTHEELLVRGAVQDPTTGRVEVLHTVGELKDIADYMREKPALSTTRDARDIWGEYFKQLENAQKLVTATSTYGPGGSTIRGS